MTEAAGESMESGCCGGAGHDHHAHAHEDHAHEDHAHEGHAHAGMCAQDAACASSADSCAEGDACCGGHSQDLFAFPTTTEVVSVPAVTLAGVLDLVEKLAPDMVSLEAETDYQEGLRLLGEQAPELVALRAAFLDRMTALLNEVAASHSD